MAKRHIENANWRELSSEPWGHRALGNHVNHRMLTDDPVNGGYTGIIEVPRRFDSRKVLACTSEFQAFILEGTLLFDDIEMHPGTFCYYPRNSPHGRWRSSESSRFLIICDSKPSFYEAKTKIIAHNSVRMLDSWKLNWVNPLDVSDPSNEYRQGIMVKVLRTNPETGASTHLAGLMPGWFANGLEKHPIFEENYCLSGDVNIATVDGAEGYTMTEGSYLCRPPGIPHGPISSKNGNVNFCYTPGKLGIDYQDIEDNDYLIHDHLRNYPWR